MYQWGREPQARTQCIQSPGMFWEPRVTQNPYGLQDKRGAGQSEARGNRDTFSRARNTKPSVDLTPQAGREGRDESEA